MSIVEKIHKIFKRNETSDIIDYKQISDVVDYNNMSLPFRNNIFNCYLLTDNDMLDFIKHTIRTHLYNSYIDACQKYSNIMKINEWAYMDDIKNAKTLQILKSLLTLGNTKSFSYMFDDYDFDMTSDSIPSLVYYKGQFMIQFGKIDCVSDETTVMKVCKQILELNKWEYDEKQYKIYF